MPLSRKKSCVPCRRSKARCDQKLTCSRCITRCIDCVYEGEARVSPYLWTPAATGVEMDPWMPSESSSIATMTVDATQPLLDDLDWLQKSPDIDFADSMKLLAPQALPVVALEASVPGEDARSGAIPKSAPTRDLSRPLSGVFPTTSPETQLVSETRGPLQRRFFWRHCVLSNIIVGQMTSYPKLMVEGDTLPPFITPPCFIREDLAPECGEAGRHCCLPEDLSVCASLVRMFYDRSASTRAYAWKSIYAEAEKLHGNYLLYDINRQLTVLQALVVYTLLQAGDPATAEENGAGRLLTQVQNVAGHLSGTIIWNGEISRIRPQRTEWVYVESLIRIVTTLGILDILLEGIRTQSQQDIHHGVCAFPLPSHRELWSARSNRAWRAAFGRYATARKGNKIITATDLVDYDAMGFLTDTTVSAMISDDVADVMFWAENVDALGSLVWMSLAFMRFTRQESLVGS
ncbi:uncharacterized protein F5Z01DRAFT_638941 [Emericellopsis atlantica]|uniref:Zn(2)-C6 fungal-type domain-containing protein n=1 Tax=Emericellopsis atlantica TaxID=2614577 RepID=A0A9P7ZHJ2_9HYPO|nr:uncharacterized protein F5Z01DRAFT_638941 [Emericellopsis atlantica]KAG9251962.1 hypothetical protein F5Z01DRAFT_638941 [Emericellopsis atlantica]